MRQTQLQISGSPPMNAGKVVRIRGDVWVWHQNSYARYSKITNQSYGVRVPVVVWLAQNGVTHLMFWLKDQNTTLNATLDDLQAHGISGKDDVYGGTINLPLDYWRKDNGHPAVPFLRNDEVTLLLPSSTPPWPVAQPVTNRHPVKPPTLQDSLF